MLGPSISKAASPDRGCVEMDWMTLSRDARNLAYNNVAHVGPDFARQKTESWAAASASLRERRPRHLDLAYAPGERTKWDLYPAADAKGPSSSPAGRPARI
jgi:arylformamidase